MTYIRTIYYLPAIVPLIAATILWIWIFNPDFGLLNYVLKNFGIGKIQWIYSSDTVIPSLILMSLWDVGPLMIIFLAGLQGVPRTLYEAADIDGASNFRKFYQKSDNYAEIILNLNYRSTQSILNFANESVKNIDGRLKTEPLQSNKNDDSSFILGMGNFRNFSNTISSSS